MTFLGTITMLAFFATVLLITLLLLLSIPESQLRTVLLDESSWLAVLARKFGEFIWRQGGRISDRFKNSMSPRRMDE